MSEALVLVVLVWAALLVPSALRSRKASPHATVGGFERAMNVLRTDERARASSRKVLVPADASRIVDHEIGLFAAGPYAGRRAAGAAVADEPLRVPDVAEVGFAGGEVGPGAGVRAPAPAVGAPAAAGHRAENPVMVRRRAWFVRALIATGATGLIAAVFGGWAWLIFLPAAAGTIGYVVLLRRLKVQRDEARRVVAELDLHRDRLPEPVSAVAGGGWSSGSVRLRRWDD